MSTDNGERGRYIPTGWRVIGRGAEAIAERAAEYNSERLTPGPASDTLYALSFTLQPQLQGRPTVERLLSAITDDVRKTWAECPRLSRDQEVSRSPSRFGGFEFEFSADLGKEWVGEIVWRAVHPVVAGAPNTTRVIIEERPSYTRVGVRVTADDGVGSVRGHVGAGQAQPHFIRALRDDGITPTWLGGPLVPHVLRRGDVRDLLASVLGSSERTFPAVVLAPLEDGDYVVDPQDLAWELLGRARLWVLRDHPQTFELTDAVGDRTMSCYWGAARAYMPGWSRHDDPYDHPLLVGDRLDDPVMRAAWQGGLSVWLGSRLELPPSIDKRRLVPSPSPSAANDRVDSSEKKDARSETTNRNSVDSQPVVVSKIRDHRFPAVDLAHAPSDMSAEENPQFEKLLSEISGLGKTVLKLADEVERLTTISAVRSSSTNAIERRLARLEDILEEAFPSTIGETDQSVAPADRDRVEAESDDEDRSTLANIVDDIADSYPDSLVFLDSARASASVSPYEDPERVRAILDAMARVSRTRRNGMLGTSLRETFADLGIDYRGAIAKATSARLREQYRFQFGKETIEAVEHIALGSTYDPRRCLRIYFTSRIANDPRFVVAHVGRHFEVKTST